MIATERQNVLPEWRTVRQEEGLIQAYMPDLLGWFSSVFAAPPQPETVRLYRDDRIAALCADVIREEPRFEECLTAMQRIMASDADENTVAAQLGYHFGRLFVGIDGPETIAPYESAFVGDGKLFQRPFSTMMHRLTKHGLRVSMHEPPDHLTVQLALLAHFTRIGHEDAVALAGDLKAWVPRFSEVLERRDGSGFYAAAARAILIALTWRDCDPDTV